MVYLQMDTNNKETDSDILAEYTVDGLTKNAAGKYILSEQFRAAALYPTINRCKKYSDLVDTRKFWFAVLRNSEQETARFIEDVVLEYLAINIKNAEIREISEAKKYYEKSNILLKSLKYFFTDCPYESYKRLEKLYLENEYISDESFTNICGKELCSAWGQVNKKGEFFKGFWKYPEDSEQYKDAWLLTRESNIKKLINIKYPRRLILEIIKIGCANHKESIRFCESTCHFVKTMHERMHDKRTYVKTMDGKITFDHNDMPQLLD